MKTLETERLFFRPWTLTDLDDLFAYAQNPLVGPSAGWAPHKTKQESYDCLTQFLMPGESIWALSCKAEDRVIGAFGFPDDTKRRNIRAKMMWYELSADYWGRGLATEAAQRVMRFGFEELSLELVSVYHYPENTRSRRVIEKCGLIFEGMLRRTIRTDSGDVHNEMCYSLLAEEYAAMHPRVIP